MYYCAVGSSPATSGTELRSRADVLSIAKRAGGSVDLSSHLLARDRHTSRRREISISGLVCFELLRLPKRERNALLSALNKNVRVNVQHGSMSPVHLRARVPPSASFCWLVDETWLLLLHNSSLARFWPFRHRA